jgi:hypothetical protein
MNREQRRKLNLTSNESKVFEELVNMSKVKKALDDWKPIPEGTKAKLNMVKITSHPDWNPNTTDWNHRRYVDWINAHKDDVFTIKYDPKYKINPQMLCLKEDTTNPQWLFHESDLIVLEDDKK